jgi:hypothetical protein
MSADANKKGARTFQCRQVLWETFDRMARELECSIDYLVNEAMKQYARQRVGPALTPAPPQAPPALPVPKRPPLPVPPRIRVPSGPRLSVMYRREKLEVTKDRFVIGRGKRTSDLILSDPNVSRQHAMIELQGGVYFLVDMGSTNGVEQGGQRIARRQISEGDTFRICDHEIRFTYR